MLFIFSSQLKIYLNVSWEIENAIVMKPSFEREKKKKNNKVVTFC